MVEKRISPPRNVVDLARYRTAKAMMPRLCRYCGAGLSEGERDEECSSALNLESASAPAPRRFYAE